MAIICDIDDTLLRNGTQPIERTIAYVNDQHSRTAVILVTGRPESQRIATVRALKAAGVKYNRLIMNPGSTANSNAYKYETALRLKQSTNITMAIDNNEDARRAYRRAGIKNVVNPSSLPDLKKFWNYFFVRHSHSQVK